MATPGITDPGASMTAAERRARMRAASMDAVLDAEFAYEARGPEARRRLIGELAREARSAEGADTRRLARLCMEALVEVEAALPAPPKRKAAAAA